jgi:tRNA A-37 threonylcarbamoyl transferase component Bud32
MIIGNNCDLNCYELSNYVLLSKKLLNQTIDLNATNLILFKKNEENELLNKNLNETLKNLTILNDYNLKLLENNSILISSLTKKNLENENLNKNLVGLIIGLVVSIGVILFSIIFIILCGIFFILFILIFIIIVILSLYKFKQYKKNLEFEKLLLGQKNKNINLGKFIEINEDDFKIQMKDVKIIEEIGEGTSAFVFKGKYNNEFVAVKMFKQNLLESNSEEFKKELILISKLKNSNIVNFIGFIVEKTQFGIVLEYCDFKTLKSFIQENENLLKWKLKLKLLLDVSKGMEYIHFKKLIHRDLKLENVLITKQLVAKITDFGISRKISESNTKTMRVGTALYMAPEVILTNNYDQKCDIFSFSIIMFQILTKKIDIYSIGDEEEKKFYQNEEISNKKEKKNENSKIIEMNEISNNSNNIANIELRVANDKNFRPIISKKFENKKKYFEFIDLMKKCWNHNPKERPGFNEITMTLQEINENNVKRNRSKSNYKK